MKAKLKMMSVQEADAERMDAETHDFADTQPSNSAAKTHRVHCGLQPKDSSHHY